MTTAEPGMTTAFAAVPGSSPGMTTERPSMTTEVMG
jgi:hypothetical protein